MGVALDEYLWELSGLHRRLKEIVDGLSADALDKVPAKDANSIAVLVTHALASELDWLHRAAARSHERDRDSEFRVRERGADDLRRAVDEAESAVPDLVRAAYEAGLETMRDRPNARPVSVSFCLTHAATHLAEHVGHAEVTRQVVAPGG